MNKFVILYPEILSAVIKNKEEDFYSLWLLSKTLNENKNGLVDYKNLIEIAKNYLGYSSNHIYKKISSGIGLYWREPSGSKGKKIIGLLSIEKIVDRLKPNITRSKPFIVNLDYFLSDSKDIKNLFVSLVAGRYEDGRPISLQTLVDNLGISESSVRNSLKDCLYVKIKSNYVILEEFNFISDAFKSNHFNPNDKTIKIHQNNDKVQVLKQISNSYIISEFDRLSLKKRPKILRKYDKIMLDKLQDRIYNISETTKLKNNQKIVSFNA